MTKQEVKDAIFSLDYVSGQLKVYGEKNDYDHDLLLRHLEDVVKKIKSDKSSS
jgi:hypothetical protein